MVHSPQSMVYGLWTINHGLWTIDHGLWTIDHGLWTIDHELRHGRGVTPEARMFVWVLFHKTLLKLREMPARAGNVRRRIGKPKRVVRVFSNVVVLSFYSANIEKLFE